MGSPRHLVGIRLSVDLSEKIDEARELLKSGAIPDLTGINLSKNDLFEYLLRRGLQGLLPAKKKPR